MVDMSPHLELFLKGPRDEISLASAKATSTSPLGLVVVLQWSCIGYAVVLLVVTCIWAVARRSSFKGPGSARRWTRFAAAADNTPRFVQIGFTSVWLGSSVRTAWIVFLVLTQVAVGLLEGLYYYTVDSDIYFPFTLAYYPSALILCIVTQMPLIKHLFLARSSLEDATHVLIEEEDDEPDVDNMAHMACRKRSKSSISRVSAGSQSWQPGIVVSSAPTKQGSKRQTLVEVVTEHGFAGRRVFTYLCVRYLWQEDERRFRPVGAASLTADSIDCTGLDGNTVQQLRDQSLNIIDVAVPSVAESLAVEFSGSIYVFQLYCVWLAAMYWMWNVVFVVFATVCTSGVVKALWIVRKQQMDIKEMACFDEPVDVLRDGEWQVVSSTDLVPRDVLKPRPGIVPVDCVLSSGGAVTNESMLTGEPMPVQKFPIEVSSAELDSRKHKKHMLFAGAATSIRRCSVCCDSDWRYDGEGPARSHGSVSIPCAIQIKQRASVCLRNPLCLWNVLHVRHDGR